MSSSSCACNNVPISISKCFVIVSSDNGHFFRFFVCLCQQPISYAQHIEVRCGGVVPMVDRRHLPADIRSTILASAELKNNQMLQPVYALLVEEDRMFRQQQQQIDVHPCALTCAESTCPRHHTCCHQWVDWADSIFV